MEDQYIEEMNVSEYKKYHESLMQNNHGTTALHVFSCIFFTVQCSIYSSVKIKNLRYQEFYEYMVIVLPLILAHTVLSDYLFLLNTIIFTTLAWEVKTYFYLKYVQKIQRQKSNHKRIQTISMLRGLTYLITIFCILAVDFRSFPRNLAKTEKYGYSLMDTGAGLFVLMSGIVHKDYQQNQRDALFGLMKFTVILLGVGLVRFGSVKQLNYQEHETEYGVHWNFFFTLAVCKLISTFYLFFESKVKSTTSIIVKSFVILIIHEFILFCGLQDWVLGDTPRESILSANREGLSSCLGYVAMYLFATQLKDELTNKHYARIYCYKGYTINPTFFKLTAGAIILWILTFVCNYFKPASRTLANAAYCIFMESIMLTVIIVMYFFEYYFHNEKGNLETPKIIENVNSNGFLYFLIANLLTGGINLSIRTFSMSSLSTFVLLNVYMIVTMLLLRCAKKVDNILFS